MAHTHRSLNLEGNELGETGIVDMCRGLRENKTLTSINVSQTEFGDSKDGVLACHMCCDVSSSHPLVCVVCSH